MKSTARAARCPPARSRDAVYDVPCMYQAYPRQSVPRVKGRPKDRRPTVSIESRNNWATKENAVLDQMHKELPPTHEAVVKFSKPVDFDDHREFIKRFNSRLNRFVRMKRIPFAVYWIREIEPNNVIHYHLLIRTTNANPVAIIAGLIKTFPIREPIHCERIRDVKAITAYVTKNTLAVKTGGNDVLLFEAGHRFKLSGHMGGYFTRRKVQLWNDWRTGHYSGE